MATNSTKTQDVRSSVTIDVDREAQNVRSRAPTTFANDNNKPAGEGTVDHTCYKNLYLAALEGNWESAASFIRDNPNAVTECVSEFSMTSLHVAALEGHGKFVEELVELMPAEKIAMHDEMGYTALHYAAMSGNIRSVKALVKRNSNLPQIVDAKGWTPILSSAVFADTDNTDKQVIWYLSLVTKDEEPSYPFTGSHAGHLITSLISAGLHDICLYLLERYPNLATAKNDKGYTALHALASRSADFHVWFRFWERICIHPFVAVEPLHMPPRSIMADEESLSHNSILGEMHELHWIRRMFRKSIELLVPRVKDVRSSILRHHQAVKLVKHICAQLSHKNHHEIVATYDLPNVMVIAATFGAVDFIQACLQCFPALIWVVGHRILQIAIENRHQHIFKLLNKTIGRNKMLAEMVSNNSSSTDNLLHLVAKLPPKIQLSYASAAAFQMQMEFQWFIVLEVKKLVSPVCITSVNDKGQIPLDLFKEEHKELIEKGEKWIKDTSNSCMLASTLIATVVFAAIFTVPGGHRDTGIPILLRERSFAVFIISDALALFFSLVSLLMFLSNLTSRFYEVDFRIVLPRRLIIGLGSLGLAIATMLAAFAATLSITFDEKWKWVYTPVTLLASFPVIMFLTQKLPLFFQMIQGLYGSTFQPQRIW